MKILLIVLLSIILLVVAIFFYIKIKLRGILKEFFDTTSLREAFEKAEQETEETPKSISSMEPIYKEYSFISINDVIDEDIFERGLCLPSDIKNTQEDMQRIIEIVRSQFI